MIPDLTKRKGGQSGQRKKVKNIKCYVFQDSRLEERTEGKRRVEKGSVEKICEQERI